VPSAYLIATTHEPIIFGAALFVLTMGFLAFVLKIKKEGIFRRFLRTVF